MGFGNTFFRYFPVDSFFLLFFGRLSFPGDFFAVSPFPFFLYSSGYVLDLLLAYFHTVIIVQQCALYARVSCVQYYTCTISDAVQAYLAGWDG